MDRMIQFMKQYRFVVLVLVIGIGLMLLPEGRDTEEVVVNPETVQKDPSAEERLAAILSAVEGAGKVEVLLTIAAGAETLYQCDTDSSLTENGESIRQDAVIVTDSQRNESGLIQRIDPPLYQGAVIVCQGADSPAVKLSIVEAVCDATGLTADKITVLKMK